MRAGLRRGLRRARLRPQPDAGARLEALALDSSAEVALAVLDHLGWADAVLVGHSHGGGVAQRVASRWPARVRALARLGTLGTPAHLSYRVLPRPGVEAVLALVATLLPRLPLPLARSLVRRAMDGVYAPSRPTDDDVEQQVTLLRANPVAVRNMARLTRGEPCALLERDASRIEAPTVFVHGSADLVVPPAHARRVHRLMSEAGRSPRFVSVEGAGHMLASEAPEACVRAIRDLLDAPR